MLPTETLINTMDGLSHTARSWTTSRRSRWFAALLKENEIDTEAISYWNVDSRKNQRCSEITCSDPLPRTRIRPHSSTTKDSTKTQGLQWVLHIRNLFLKFSLTLANVAHATGSEDRTLRVTLHARSVPQCHQLFHISRFIQCTCIGWRLDESSQNVCRVFLKNLALTLQSVSQVSSQPLGLAWTSVHFAPTNWKKESGIPLHRSRQWWLAERSPAHTFMGLKNRQPRSQRHAERKFYAQWGCPRRHGRHSLCSVCVQTCFLQTISVDTTPSCTRADALFSCDHHSAPFTHLSALFPMLSNRQWLKVKGISVAHCLKTIFISFVMSLLNVPFVSLLSLHRLLVLCHDPQRHQLRWKVAESTQCFCSPEWNVWLLGQSDSTHRLWVQLLKLHEREVHADQPPGQSLEFPAPRRRHHNQQQALRSKQSSHPVRIFRCESLETTAWVGWQSCEHTSNRCYCGQCCNNNFWFTIEREERSRTQTLCILWERKISRKSLNGKWTWLSGERASREESCDRESINGSDSGITEQSKFLVRRRGISRSWIKEQLWSNPRSRSNLYYSESKNPAALRFWIAAWYTEHCGYFRTRFWRTTCSRRTILDSLQ